MARTPRKQKTEDPQLNLAPIMNMVVILIPLLLLSVVFLKVGVVNVSTPELGPMPSSNTTPEERLGLTVGVDDRGFTISTSEQTYAPIAGCPTPGPTICLTDGRRALDSPVAPGATDDEVEGALAQYDWAALYNELVRVKSEHGEQTEIKIGADAQTPYAAIVRVMDVSRFKLAAGQYASSSDFWSARYAGTHGRREPLFPDPILAVVR